MHEEEEEEGARAGSALLLASCDVGCGALDDRGFAQAFPEVVKI